MQDACRGLLAYSVLAATVLSVQYWLLLSSERFLSVHAVTWYARADSQHHACTHCQLCFASSIVTATAAAWASMLRLGLNMVLGRPRAPQSVVQVCSAL